MRKIIAICLAALLLLNMVPVFAAAIEDASVTEGCNTLDGQMPFLGTGQLVNNTAAAVVYETKTDTLMYAHNPDTQLAPSSLVKILTALIAIEKGNMMDVVTVQADVLNTLAPDAAVVELVVDEVLTVEDLLYCMMVGSGNDATVVLADHVLGSQAAFVEEMNRYAAELGCTGTHFTNVHGLHDKDQYTTARDVAKILKRAVTNETFCKIFGAKYYSVAQTNKADARHLSTQNYLMNNDNVVAYFDERVVGSRTGVANDRSRCIASVAQVNDMELICIVMGAESVYEKDGYSVKVYGGYDETSALLDLGFNGHRTVQVLHPNQVFQQASVLEGSSDVTIGTRTGASSVIPDSIDVSGLTYRVVDAIPMTTPISEGQRVSTLQVWYGSVCIAQSELYAMNSVINKSEQFLDLTPDKQGGILLKVLLYIFAGFCVILLVGFIVLSALRTLRISKVRRQSRRNRRSRRRSR